MMRQGLAWLTAGALTFGLGSAVAAPPGTPAVAPAKPGAEKDLTREANGRRTVRGEVRRVNEARGTLTLKTDDGDLDLHLPASAVRGIKKGDRVTIHLSVTAAAPAGAKVGLTGRAPGAGKADGSSKGPGATKTP